MSYIIGIRYKGVQYKIDDEGLLSRMQDGAAHFVDKVHPEIGFKNLVAIIEKNYDNFTEGRDCIFHQMMTNPDSTSRDGAITSNNLKLLKCEFCVDYKKPEPTCKDYRPI